MINLNNFRTSFYISISFLGILFWFTIGYPFDLRNEAFSWAAFFDSSGFLNVVSERISSVKSFRPLSQFIAWGLYKISGGDGDLIQLLNFSLLSAAFYLFASSSLNKLSSAVSLFACGLFFFSSFYFIFNLHGLFYSFLIFFCSFLLYFQNWIFFNRFNTFASFSIAVAFYFIHPFALIIYFFFLTGAFMEKKVKFNSSYISFVVISFLLIVLSSLPILFSGEINPANFFRNFYFSLLNVEVGGLLSPFVLFLLIFFLFFVDFKFNKFFVLSIIFFTGLFFIILKIPVLFVLFISAVYISLHQKKYILFTLLLSSLLFPLLVDSASPVKVSLALPLSFVILSESLIIPAKIFTKLNYFYVAAFAVIFLSVALWSRFNNNIPFVRHIAKSILVEKEKTYQLKEILNWYFNTDSNCKLIINEAKIPLNQSTLSFNRNSIPPVIQSYLDEYVFVHKKNIDSSCSLFISFGEEHLMDKKPIFEVSSENSGFARVYY